MPGKSILIAAAFSALAGAADPPVEYFQPGNIIRFADHLFAAGEYQRAIGEYQRYLFCFDPPPANADTVWFRMARCFLRTGAFPRAVEFYQRVREWPASGLADDALLQIGYCRYLGKDYERSRLELSAGLTEKEPADPRLGERMRQLMAVDLMMEGKWGEAGQALARDASRDAFAGELRGFLNAYRVRPRKSPVLAGLGSAAVPGLGKLYCRRPFDAFASFTSVAILGWEAYDGFRGDGSGSVKGWVFLSVGAVFYLGNVYGSIVSADLYNEEAELRLIEKVRLRVNAHFD